MHCPGALHHALLPHNVLLAHVPVGFCIDAGTNVQNQTQIIEIHYNSSVMYVCLGKISPSKSSAVIYSDMRRLTLLKANPVGNVHQHVGPLLTLSQCMLQCKAAIYLL